MTGKKAGKFLWTVCLAAGAAVLGAVITCRVAAGSAAQGFRSPKNAMREILRKGE